MKKIQTDILHGDCVDILKKYPDSFFDLLITSPPYADSRKNTYGGIKPEKYVFWFLPRTEQFLRGLKPSGTFVLNIKERVVDGERSTYVLELILEMRKQGWLRTEESIGSIKKLCVKSCQRYLKNIKINVLYKNPMPQERQPSLAGKMLRY